MPPSPRHSCVALEAGSGRIAQRDAGEAPHVPMPAALATWLAWHDFPDAHSRGIGGVTPLMVAARRAAGAIVDALIAQGARLDALDDAGNNALWYACASGAPAPILRLVDAGVDVDHANDDDITCAIQAAASGRIDVMRLLIACGANAGLCAPDGRSALDIAAAGCSRPSI